MVTKSDGGAFLKKLFKHDLSKKQLITGATSGVLVALALGYFYKNKNSEDKTLYKVPTKDVVKESNVTQETFQTVMKQYSEKFAESKIFERILPRAFKDNADVDNILPNMHYSDKYDVTSLNKGLSDPIYDLLDRGGKRWRPILCFLIAEAYGKTINDVIEIAGVCEFVHNGSLVIDDIEDQSQTRRGKPCIHLTHGLDVSINAGCLMFFAPFHLLQRCGKYTEEQLEKFSKIYFEEMVSIHCGQAWDIVWHNTNHPSKVPDEKNYLQMTAHKTGVLARMCARLTGEAIGLKKDHIQKLTRFAEKIGVAFQIQDDVLNITGEEYVKTKGFSGEDIHEGKKSLLVIHSLKVGTEKDRNRLFEILDSKTDNQEVIEEAIQLLKKTGSIEYAQQVADRLVKEAWNEVADILPNRQAKWYLKALSEFFTKRSI